MHKILYFDYCALILLIILMTSMVLKGLYKGRKNISFMMVLITSFLCVVADIFCIKIDGYAGMAGWEYFFHCTYLILHNITTPLYIHYVITLVGAEYKISKKSLLISAIPLIIAIIAIISSPLNKWLFYIDERGIYTRGNGFVILYVATVIYLITLLLVLWKNRHVMSLSQFLAASGLVPVMALAVLIQYLRPDLLLEMIANALGLTFILLIIQKPEMLTDATTKYYNSSTFLNDVRRIKVDEQKSGIIIINIVNYSSILNMLGYTESTDLVGNIAKTISHVYESAHISVTPYYMRTGRFRIIMDYGSLKRMDELANLLNERFKKGIKLHGVNINVLAMICVVKFPEEIKDVDTLVAFANDLNGANYTGDVLYAADIYEYDHYDLMDRMDVIIEDALANNRLEVYYQPIFHPESDGFNSAEALLRLRDKNGRFISPEIFIPAAEKNGAIHKIGNYVFREVCRFISSEEFMDLGINYIEINLSVAQCMSMNLVNDLSGIMKEFDVAPEKINLEITETAASDSQQSLMDNIMALHKYGVAFSLDDYGTGYSNMSRIAAMPFSIIKIDKSIVDALEDNKKIPIILENTIKMVKDMNMEIVIEGVETKELLETFVDMGCDYIQGYYFSRALPQKDFCEYIRKQNSR